jgi:group II intron reverse transcriptase/maturase
MDRTHCFTYEQVIEVFSMKWNERFATLKSLHQAWKSVRQAGGGAGVDGISLDNFRLHADQQLSQMSQQIIKGRYRFSRLRVAKLPKPNGQLRTLGIPTVADRIVLQSIRQSIEPECDRHMSSCSHAYRPARGAMTALADVAESIRAGYHFVLESDIAAFFDSIHHRSLLMALKQIDRDLAQEDLICKSLAMSAGIWAARKGISQGSPLSPLLSNVALIDFDRQMTRAGHRLVRYADDFVVLGRSAAETESAKTLAVKLLKSIQLTLHPEKTRAIDSRQNSFTFLGFELHPDRIVPTAKNLSELRSGVLACCNPHVSISWGERIERINALLRSFAWYYHQTDSKRIFWSLDAFVIDQLNDLATSLGLDDESWRARLVRMSDMREVSWRSSKGKKCRGWNGYGS